MIQLGFKDTKLLSKFKAKTKKWNPKSCPCPPWKTYLQNIGFI